jgi:ABC-2 type transport system ATP-binding protein
MRGVGQWAIDWVTGEGMETTYFPDRETARQRTAKRNGSYTVRRVNLEDAFLSLTGKKVAAENGHRQAIHNNHSHGHGAHGHGKKAMKGHG